MLKRLIAWFKRRKVEPTPETLTVYGVGRNPDNPRQGIQIPLREIPKPKVVVVRKSEWPAPEPRALVTVGPSEAEHRERGQRQARQWLVKNLPDECTFL